MPAGDTASSRTMCSAKSCRRTGSTTRSRPFILLISLVVFATLIPDFFSVYGLTDNARQLGELMFVVLGMTLVMLAGGIDLSVGSNFALTTFLSLGMFNALGWPVPIVVLGSCWSAARSAWSTASLSAIYGSAPS